MSRITSFLGRHKKALIVLAVLAVAGTVGWTRMNQAAAAAQRRQPSRCRPLRWKG